MGSATREALSSAKTALAALAPRSVTLTLAEELLAASRVIGDSTQLRALLSDPSDSADQKKAVISALFASTMSETTQEILTSSVSAAWSNEDDMVLGVEELGYRAAAESAEAGVPIDQELFGFMAVVSSNSELELAVGSKLDAAGDKAALVERLLASKVTPQTLAIVRHIVMAPRGRRFTAAMQHAAAIVADQANFLVATVTSAVSIDPAQLGRLQKGLADSYGRDVRINEVVDADIVGGLRVQIGDEIIDGSVANRLTDLRLQLAG